MHLGIKVKFGICIESFVLKNLPFTSY